MTASEQIRSELAAINQEYEDRFGFIYLVRADGRTAAELLSIARSRLSNDHHTELRIAAEEQWKITELRLARWLNALANADHHQSMR